MIAFISGHGSLSPFWHMFKIARKRETSRHNDWRWADEMTWGSMAADAKEVKAVRAADRFWSWCHMTLLRVCRSGLAKWSRIEPLAVLAAFGGIWQQCDMRTWRINQHDASRLNDAVRCSISLLQNSPLRVPFRLCLRPCRRISSKPGNVNRERAK